METMGIPASLHRSIESALHDVFHLSDFRPLQREIISRIFLEQSQLAILPTGAGKSLCYQLPSVLLPKPTVVISPLLSLMREQTRRLSELGIAAAQWSHWDSLAKPSANVLRDWRQGRYHVIFLAPERIRHPDLLRQINHLRCSLLVVDEAHSISEWGHDFRPDYRRIKQFHRLLGAPPVLALTATATRQVEDDILRQLGLGPDRCVVHRQPMERTNIFLAAETAPNRHQQHTAVLGAVRQEPGAMIVYTATRKQTEYWGRWLSQNLSAGGQVGIYHAGMNQAERMAVHDAFSHGKLRLVVATTAFGMGIDRSDVRGVINIGLPESLDSYTQQWGRAGRDGERAWARLIVTPADITQRLGMLERERPRLHMIHGIMAAISQRPLHQPLWWHLGTQDGDGEALWDIVLTALEDMEAVQVVAKKAHQALVDVKKPMEQWMTHALKDRLTRLYGHRLAQYEQMRAYIGSPTCRREVITQYFGQVATNPGPHTAPECCDICDRRLDPSPASTDSLDLPMFERLRAWRQMQARQEHVAPYMIFGDRALRELCERHPTNVEQVRQCFGVGPVKCARYGEALVALFRDAASTAPSENMGTSAKQEAWALFMEGIPIAQVAERVDRKPSTVIGYLEAWIDQEDTMAWRWYGDSLVHPRIQKQVKSVLISDPSQSLKSLFSALGGQYSYDLLRIARALVRKSWSSTNMSG